MLTPILFIALVLVSAVAAVWLLSSGTRGGVPGVPRVGRLLGLAVPLAARLGLLAALAKSGCFQVSNAMPPRILIAFLPVPLLVPYLVLSRQVAAFAASLPGTWLLGLQVFRVFVELLLIRLHDVGLVPRSMTFRGRNFSSSKSGFRVERPSGKRVVATRTHLRGGAYALEEGRGLLWSAGQ